MALGSGGQVFYNDRGSAGMPHGRGAPDLSGGESSVARQTRTRTGAVLPFGCPRGQTRRESPRYRWGSGTRHRPRAPDSPRLQRRSLAPLGVIPARTLRGACFEKPGLCHQHTRVQGHTCRVLVSTTRGAQPGWRPAGDGGAPGRRCRVATAGARQARRPRDCTPPVNDPSRFEARHLLP